MVCYTPDVPPRTRISLFVALELCQRGCSASPATIRASSHEPSSRSGTRAGRHLASTYPATGEGQTSVMTEAPLNAWSVIGTFPTEEDCDAALLPKALLPKPDQTYCRRCWRFVFRPASICCYGVGSFSSLVGPTIRSASLVDDPEAARSVGLALPSTVGSWAASLLPAKPESENFRRSGGRTSGALGVNRLTGGFRAAARTNARRLWNLGPRALIVRDSGRRLVFDQGLCLTVVMERFSNR